MWRWDRRRGGWTRRGGLAAVLVLVACTTAAATEAPPRPNFVLVTLDTTRADRLGLYGYGRNTSPHLDRLALDSVVYERAYSTSSWTLPAHASLFTGHFPASHGARFDAQGTLALAKGIVGPFSERELRARGLSMDQPTLASLLAAQGYQTAGFVAGPWMKKIFTLDRGFDHYDDADVNDVKGRLAAQLTDAALPWIEAHAQERFFLFLNYYDPHGPYADPEGLIRRFLPTGAPAWPPQSTPQYLDAAYDAEILYMDQHFGRLLDRLRELGLYDDAWIIVTADHGELLGEQGAQGNGRSLYQAEIRVPFLVKYPKGVVAPGRSMRPVQLTDVLPMLLDRLGVALPSGLPARAGEAPPVLAEVLPLTSQSQAGDWRAWIVDDQKLLWNSYGRHQLFDLSSDPTEANDLAAESPDRLRTLLADLDAFLAALPEPGPPVTPEPGDEIVDDKTRRALEALGYLE